MSWIDTTVVVIIIIVGLIIMYKALKEPLDLLFGFVGMVLVGIKDKVAGAGDAGGAYYEEIRYG